MVASDRMDAPLYCHEKDRASVAKRMPVHETFSGRHMLDDDFEVIPTPGHTRGATAFLWASGDHRLLFTSDPIYLRDGEWVATVLGESDRASYVESLEILRDLDFDVLVPWAATKGQPCCAKTDQPDARRRIGMILERVRRGEDHWLSKARRTRTLHLTGPALRSCETSRSLQPARQGNAIARYHVGSEVAEVVQVSIR